MKPDSAATAAALRGATLAFRKDKLEVGQRAEGAGAGAGGGTGAAAKRDNGAFTAATEAVRGRAEALDGKTQHQQLHMQHTHTHTQQTEGGVSSAAARMDAKSQSLIAATLAASRSTSPTADVDSNPLASAGSLISMFEKARGRPSPPESVGSSVEDRADKKKSSSSGKPVAVNKGDGPPTPPAARKANPKTQIRRDPVVAEAGAENEDKRKGPARTKVAAPEASSVSAASIAAQRQQQQQLQQSQQSQQSQQLQQQQPARSRDGQPISLPPRPMTPTTISKTASQPSTPAPSSDQKSSQQTQTRPRALHPSTPPPLKPLMSRNVVEVVSPRPTRVARAAPLSPVTSPHLTLSPNIHVALTSPSPDPPKKIATAKRPPTPPKPRGSGKDASEKDNQRPVHRGRSHSNRLDASSSGQVRSSMASAAASRSAGQSASPSGRRGDARPSMTVLDRRFSVMSVPSSPSRERLIANASPGRSQLDNLTDAIMAGSLASTRLTPHNTGPASLAPPPLPKRQKSPRLLHTLRQPQVPDEDEDQPKKGHRALLRKGKHAHHEGSRRKWREEIRPRERKRYEALWASNRGILLTDTRIMSPATSISSDLDRDVSQCVANVVVREVWRRSRLPVDELAEIWDLVDRGRAGMLSRAEFVVGTWLVDQRLKGRKVPAKVTDSVWGSANGVMVKGPNGK